MFAYMKYITTLAWCMEHARPALGGAIPIGCAVAQQASRPFSNNELIDIPTWKYSSYFSVGFIYIYVIIKK